MGQKSRKRHGLNLAVATLLLASNVLFGFPVDIVVQKWNESKIVDKMYLAMRDAKVVDVAKSHAPGVSPLVGRATAANFSIQTGYYIGTGSAQSVSGLGFQPQSIFIKANTATGQGVWKSKDMAASNTAYFSATANDTGTMVTLNSDGFSINTNANVNSVNVRYAWVAFAGSDCTSNGTVCIGTYTGNGTNPRLITTGFQPSAVIVKRSTAVAGNFRSAAMASNMGQYFTATAQDTAGALFTTLTSNGFNVGATNNTSAGVYYYIAFKPVTGVMGQGSYTGNGVDNTNITGFGSGAMPDFAFVKNATSITTANRNPVMNISSNYGDSSSYMSAATANAVNMIQALQSDGIQVGTGANVNESAQTMYWVAFGGASAPPAGSGTFTMATGSYTGTGASLPVTGTGFRPDLVIIKDSAANHAVFRTSLMAGDSTAYLANAAANVTSGITSLDNDGFTVGTNAAANTISNTYHWQAFGNAYKPTTNAGADDFMIGAYYGNGIDSRNITGLPTQPDMVAVKRNGTTAATWRSSAVGGDSSSFFAATAEGANRVQALQSFGFQIGASANVNTSANVYNWFAFKNGANFATNSYTGTGSSQAITSPGFQPDLVWAKRSTAVNGVQRGSSIAGNSSQYFGAVANAANRITGLVCGGFSLTGTATETNASGGTYRYAAWRDQAAVLSADIVDGSGCSVAVPGIAMSATSTSFTCTTTTGTLGTSGQKLRVTNTTATPGWILSIAPTDGSSALWSSGSAVYDFNDPSGVLSGCSAGGDADAYAGLLSFDFSSASIAPASGCTTSGVSLGTNAGFSEGVADAVTLGSASGAGTGCYWDFDNIGLNQTVPASQPPGSYELGMTVTITSQ